MYDLIEHSENYPWVYGYLWVCYSDQLVLDNNGDSIDFSINGDTRLSFKYKNKWCTGKEMMEKKIPKYWNMSTTEISK